MYSRETYRSTPGSAARRSNSVARGQLGRRAGPLCGFGRKELVRHIGRSALQRRMQKARWGMGTVSDALVAAGLRAVCLRAQEQLMPGAFCASSKGHTVSACRSLRAATQRQAPGSTERTCDLMRVLPPSVPAQAREEEPRAQATFPERLFACEAGPRAQTFAEVDEWRSVCQYRRIDAAGQRANRLLAEARDLTLNLEQMLSEIGA